MSSKNLRPIGERIREARKAVRPKLTTTELGRRIGVSNVAITRGEKGERNFSLQTLYALAQELRTDFGEDYLADYLSEWLGRMKASWHLVPAEETFGNVEILSRPSLDTQLSAEVVQAQATKAAITRVADVGQKIEPIKKRRREGSR